MVAIQVHRAMHWMRRSIMQPHAGGYTRKISGRHRKHKEGSPSFQPEISQNDPSIDAFTYVRLVCSGDVVRYLSMGPSLSTVVVRHVIHRWVYSRVTEAFLHRFFCGICGRGSGQFGTSPSLLTTFCFFRPARTGNATADSRMAHMDVSGCHRFGYLFSAFCRLAVKKRCLCSFVRSQRLDSTNLQQSNGWSCPVHLTT